MTINMKAGVVLVCGMLAANVVADAPKKTTKVTPVIKRDVDAAVKKAIADKKVAEKRAKIAADVDPAKQAVKDAARAKVVNQKKAAEAAADNLAKAKTDDEKAALTIAKKSADDAVVAAEAECNDVIVGVDEYGKELVNGGTSWVDTVKAPFSKAANYFWKEATGVQKAYRIGAVVAAAALVYAGWKNFNEASAEDAETEA